MASPFACERRAPRDLSGVRRPGGYGYAAGLSASRSSSAITSVGFSPRAAEMRENSSR